ncbi:MULTISPECIES: CalY family protein [unclassified Bacillus (in: firmicutes)]|uniref:CalY family protein n=1 Tax=unclassified Bacillus (in: firmicutes) TaxID=185979 RepID=UPI0008E6F3FD|nr:MULTISPECIES: CalY family protein [unclassified Bacillus (in: firmicutes)]SFB13433.1 spore coat-associated protein N [Bacillus sp. UNCCL13]SFQ90016.1 spore coat-associated protein N [Bacillus sp. cl95]
MSLKKKLGLGVASAALGLSLIGGGTYAYFNDKAETTGKFQAGTLDLNANPTTIISVDKIKPGDTMLRSFKLKNDGNLDIAKILLATSYTVTDANNNNTDDFGKHIRVNFLSNADKLNLPIYSTTLDQLKTLSPDVIQNSIFGGWLAERGGKLAAGTDDTLWVQYEFVDNNQDQNMFQGDTLDLKWTFEGKQGAGVAR